MENYDGWKRQVEPPFLLWKPGSDDYEKPSYMTWREEDEAKYTPEEEYDLMDQQIENSDRCVFNYHPARLDSHQFVEEPETTLDLLNMLSKGALDGYNDDNKTKYEFVKAVRANFYFAAAIMYLITFQVKDPYDGLIKNFQARVLYAKGIRLEHIFCRPQPNQQVECVGKLKTDVEKGPEKDAKRQCLEKELLHATRSENQGMIAP